MLDQSADDLLDRLRSRGSPADWARFVDLYRPLLEYWARGTTRGRAEADDLIHDVLVVAMQKIRFVAGAGERTLLGWLRTVMLNRWRDLCRRAKVRPGAVDPSILDAVAVQHHAAHTTAALDLKDFYRKALEVMQTNFEETTWRACWEAVVAARPAAEVAADLGVSVAVVYAARYRVIRRLRREFACPSA